MIKDITDLSSRYHKRPIVSMDVSEAHDAMVLSDMYGNISVWSISKLQNIYVRTVPNVSYRVRYVYILNRHKILVAFLNGSVVIYSYTDNSVENIIDTDSEGYTPIVKVSPDKTRLLISLRNQIQLWDIEKKALISSYKTAITGDIVFVDNDTIASQRGGVIKITKIYPDPTTLKYLNTSGEFFSIGGNLLATADNYSIYFKHLIDNYINIDPIKIEPVSANGRTHHITDIRLSNTGKELVVTANSDPIIRYFRIHKNKPNLFYVQDFYEYRQLGTRLDYWTIFDNNKLIGVKEFGLVSIEME